VTKPHFCKSLLETAGDLLTGVGICLFPFICAIPIYIHVWPRLHDAYILEKQMPELYRKQLIKNQFKQAEKDYLEQLKLTKPTNFTKKMDQFHFLQTYQKTLYDQLQVCENPSLRQKLQLILCNNMNCSKEPSKLRGHIVETRRSLAKPIEMDSNDLQHFLTTIESWPDPIDSSYPHLIVKELSISKTLFTPVQEVYTVHATLIERSWTNERDAKPKNKPTLRSIKSPIG